MAREVDEWIGKTADTPAPPRVKLRVFLKYEGRCQCGCGIKIANKPWQADHKLAIINGGENRESNLHPLLTEHHKNKTRADVAEKSRTYRVRSRNAGIKKERTIRSWRKFDGTPVYASRER